MKNKTIILRFFRISFILNLYYALFKYRRVKILICNDINMPLKTLFTNKVHFSHPLGIVISKYSKIGFGCRIYQNVTIGKHGKYKGAPILGDNVVVFAGSVIVGGVKVGDNSIIGANSFVNDNVPPNSFVAGSPARVIKRLN